MEKYTMFMDWKNQYSENEYTTQSNLQIQYNPYQATNGILHRARTNNFTICMEIQKTSNSQSNLEKEEQNWHGGSERPGKLEVGGASRDSTGFGEINTQKYFAFLYTNNEKIEREIKETIPFTIAKKE